MKVVIRIDIEQKLSDEEVEFITDFSSSELIKLLHEKNDDIREMLNNEGIEDEWIKNITYKIEGSR